MSAANHSRESTGESVFGQSSIAPVKRAPLLLPLPETLRGDTSPDFVFCGTFYDPVQGGTGTPMPAKVKIKQKASTGGEVQDAFQLDDYYTQPQDSYFPYCPPKSAFSPDSEPSSNARTPSTCDLPSPATTAVVPHLSPKRRRPSIDLRVDFLKAEESAASPSAEASTVAKPMNFSPFSPLMHTKASPPAQRLYHDTATTNSNLLHVITEPLSGSVDDSFSRLPAALHVMKRTLSPIASVSSRQASSDGYLSPPVTPERVLSRGDQHFGYQDARPHTPPPSLTRRPQLHRYQAEQHVNGSDSPQGSPGTTRSRGITFEIVSPTTHEAPGHNYRSTELGSCADELLEAADTPSRSLQQILDSEALVSPESSQGDSPVQQRWPRSARRDASIVFATSSPIAHAFSGPSGVGYWEEALEDSTEQSKRSRSYTVAHCDINANGDRVAHVENACGRNNYSAPLSSLHRNRSSSLPWRSGEVDNSQSFLLPMTTSAILKRQGAIFEASFSPSRYCRISRISSSLVLALTYLAGLRDLLTAFGVLRDVHIANLSNEGWIIASFHETTAVEKLLRSHSTLQAHLGDNVIVEALSRVEVIGLAGNIGPRLLSKTEGHLHMRFMDPLCLITPEVLREFLERFGPISHLSFIQTDHAEAIWDDDRYAEQACTHLLTRKFQEFEVRVSTILEEPQSFPLTKLESPFEALRIATPMSEAVETLSRLHHVPDDQPWATHPLSPYTAMYHVPTFVIPNAGSKLSTPSLRATQPLNFGRRSFPFPGVPPANIIDIDRVEGGLDSRTTVMIKNIPNKMTDTMLLSFIHNVCPRGVDFVYLRIDFESRANVGYGFANFLNVPCLLRFAKAKLGTKWGMCMSEKEVQLCYAALQGKNALIEKFRNSAVMDEPEPFRPKAFASSGPRAGLPEVFPAANDPQRLARSQTAAIASRLGVGFRI